MKIFSGIVFSNKMDKTLIVKRYYNVKDAKYKKYVNRFTKFFVHDENNKCNVGDYIEFFETKHLSKKKKWMLKNILKVVKDDSNAN